MTARRKWATLAAALVLMPAGGAMMVDAALGVGPFDVLSTGLSSSLGVTVGTAVALIFVVAGVAGAFLGARPGVGTIVLVVAIAPLFELGRSLAPDPASTPWQAVQLVVGLVVLYSGAALAVASALGAAPTEMLMVGLVGRGLPLVPVRWAMEAVMFAAGWLLGGQVGVGTALTLVVGAPVMRAVITAATPPSPDPSRAARLSR